METIAVHCSWADAQLAEDATLQLHLPSELRSLILASSGSEYINALAVAARLPTCTGRLFLLYRPVFVDVVNHWIAPSGQSLPDSIITLCSLARILPFAPYFKAHTRDLLNSSALTRILATASAGADLDEEQTTTLLVALFRLLSLDRDYFDFLLPPIFFSSLLSHDSLRVRHVAVECLCLVMHFADAFCESLLQKHVGKQPVLGNWEGQVVDFRLLKIWEERRWQALEAELDSCQRATHDTTEEGKALSQIDLHHQTALVGNVLLPRFVSLPLAPSTVVLTPNAKRGLNQLGAALIEQRPILVTGPASSGKTSLVLEAARLLNKADNLITLHLNEQTDAKSLIGLHASSPSDPTFVWHPGVLTRALQQGRWVLIEDIDRAPAEVLGVLRPIIENGDLFIPSRKQRVQAADGFRILATVRASASETSRVLTRNAWISNPRLWSMLHTESYTTSEMSYLVGNRYPELSRILEVMLEVHEKMLSLYGHGRGFKAAQSRMPSLRDLLKWCRRVNKRVEIQNLKLSSQAIPETFNVEIFKDAIDCYASHLSDEFLYNKVAASVAQIMNISPHQVQYYISGSLEAVQDATRSIRIGRTTLQKVDSRRSRPLMTPFADTVTTRRCLESVSAGIGFAEPYLLVGETGVGKTFLVQHIAALVGQKLTVINLSQQSEATDLLGGLKPVTTRSLILPLVEAFNTLFDDTFSASMNEKFQVALSRCLEKQNWSRLLKLWQEAMGMAESVLTTSANPTSAIGDARTSKRRKLATSKHDFLSQRWTQFRDSVNRIRAQVEGGDKHHAFAFVEGRLIQAVRNGEWILLDEINLASPDTLDHIVSLLHDSDSQPPSILLSEAGNVEKINAHRDFRVFAAMNPATDTGKKDLVPGLRSRFTELYVQSGDKDLGDLVKIVHSYLGRLLDNDKRAPIALARSYLDLQKLNQEHQLTDGAGDVPHFSVRSLVRCLLYTVQHSVSHGLRRAMYEGFAMSFCTVLSRESEALFLPSLTGHLLENVKNVHSFLAQQPKIYSNGAGVIAFRHHLIVKGPLSPDFQPHYIRTPSVERNLINLARAASMRLFPILLQGPTSAGKTSMVEYLAKLSGNTFIRINNHEHTDLQEYLGSYVSDVDGKLRFKGGVLVDALRNGHWLVLDELNLAPSDVLEALNRLLDDNRELLIPETQEVIRPHPNFLLFATQNPAGLYGGRKRLSRAFRNRFLEIHFDDIPEDELEVILRERAQIAPSFCTHVVAVYKKLSLLRQSSRLFEQRNSFVTLRDLFRWASRPVDDRQQLAYHGFMLLGERVRDPAERLIVKTTIEETIKITIDENVLYGASAAPAVTRGLDAIVWTQAMRRLFVLVSPALRSREPVLLVGETGCGKTQICQVMATAFGRPLNIYNAHTNTETGDLIGSQRPVRGRSQLAANVLDSFGLLNDITLDGANLDVDQVIATFSQLDTSLLDLEAVRKTKASITAYQSLFEWNDGSLVRSMKYGEHFLLDEISLADDSVLERLNSVLEPARTILLAEKGSTDNIVIAHADFQFLATMNPGGDYGKRELSAALRNRLTEIWVPPLSEEDDVLPIVRAKLNSDYTSLAPLMLKFSLWFKEVVQKSNLSTIPLRDLLAWAKFVTSVPYLNQEHAFLHGAMMVYVDSIGANPAGMTSSFSDVELSRQTCFRFLQTLVSCNVVSIYEEVPLLTIGPEVVQAGAFSLSRAQDSRCETPDFVFEAPTAMRNTMRLVRALQVDKAVLLEGSPGVGKTAIVLALAQLLGKSFTRINLSDQTDLMDLFGADAPVEGEAVGTFTWKDGPLLQAMQAGGWVLLDEMNLASQSVLEGLNSCFDHRKEAYVAELDRSFHCHPDFRLFAAQNPHHQGGGRKGLPVSFVNRFTVVYVDPFREEDLLCICRTKYPGANKTAIEAVVQAIFKTEQAVASNSVFNSGGPWEFNLRDVDRWLQLYNLYPAVDPMYHYSSVIKHRFRNGSQQRILMKQASPESFYPRLTPTVLQVGLSFLERDQNQQLQSCSAPVPASLLPQAKSVITALSRSWPVILAGSSGAGKTQLIRSLATASGAKLLEVSMNADLDTIDLIGGFEQYDEQREVEQIKEQALRITAGHILRSLSKDLTDDFLPYLKLHQICLRSISDAKSLLLALRNLGPQESMSDLVQRLETIANQSREMRTRFVWNDGVLVDAVREGCWLVLDNANLCNASVLDRLNSLLEPNGHLIISEQHDVGGGVRSIKPHQAFRIILTVDPRYGELSRAMRNRSLEVFLEANIAHRSPSMGPRYPWTASINRLRHPSELLEGEDTMGPFVDNLASEDVDVAKTHPSSESNPNLRLTIVQSVLHASRESASMIWPRVHELMNSLLTVKPLHLPEFRHRPQLLILNEPLFLGVHISDSWTSIRSLERVWRVAQDLSQITADLRAASERVSANPGGMMTALERSATITAKRNERTLPPFFSFASAMVELLQNVMTSMLKGIPHAGDSRLVLSGMLYVKDVMKLAATPDPHQAVLQAMLQIGQGLAYESQWEHFQKALSFFKTISLERGLGLQRMWHSWKPQTPATLEQLTTKVLFEKAIERFNTIAASLPEPRTTYMKIKEGLLEAAVVAWEHPDAEQVLRSMTQSLETLEAQALRRKPVGVYMQNTFDSLARRAAILDCTLTPSSLQLLKMFSDEIQLFVDQTLKATPVQRALRTLAVARTHLFSKRLNDNETLVEKLCELPKQPLRYFVRLQEELSGVATLMASNSSILGPDLLPSIRSEVAQLLIGILVTHRDHFSNRATSCLPLEGDPELEKLMQLDMYESLQPRIEANAYFHSIYQSHLRPAMGLLTSKSSVFVGRGLLHVSLAALLLIVPDKPFDPALLEQLVQQRYEIRRQGLQSKIGAHKAFNQHLMGQDSSLVLRLLEEELAELGVGPIAPAVARPKVSTLSMVQDEFLILLRTIVDAPPECLLRENPELAEALMEANRVNETIDRLLVRLGNLDRAYDDLVVPVSQLLQCVGLGAQLVASGLQDHNNSAPKSGMLSHVPLLGASPRDFMNWPVDSVLGQTDKSSFWLESYVLDRKLKFPAHKDHNTLAQLEYLRVIDGLYEQWKIRLTKGQMEAEANSRYYAYRGEDDLDGDAKMEELYNMFPSFEHDEERTDSPQSSYDGRGIAIRLANMHERVFATAQNDGWLAGFVLEALPRLSSELASQTSPTLENILPGVLLQMQAQLHAIKEESTETTINIYTDASIGESQKFYKLVQTVQTHFYEIGDRWPEHAVPAEVVSFSDELLDLEISSPLAKLLTKAEKLLEIMAQWQSVASREWSVASLTDELTTLIISWRRLELASWSRLLDLEKQKTEEDARAWYFIAYEAVVYNSRRVIDTGEDATAYARELARTIEEFMKSTSLGQYQSRLQLLETLQQSLDGATIMIPALAPITSSVASIIAHYARYLPDLVQTLKTGRAELEKAVVEQIKLASWKDTNVTALKDSARRSHQKLFKIVRQYRALLSKPVAGLKCNEPIYDQQHEPKVPSRPVEEGQQAQRALEICAAEVPGWETRPERLKNPLQSTLSLRHVYQTQLSDFDVGGEIATFREDLATASKMLRKETPATLNDDNSGLVRHLRERKKRLFADTIKSVVQMGIRRNLGTSELEKQGSLPIVLSRSPDLISNSESRVIPLANATFHELLDLMPQARIALTDHSPDLTDGEVRRSVGLLEGVLSVSIRQRDMIAQSINEYDALSMFVSSLRALASTGFQVSLREKGSSDFVRNRQLAWLPAILDVACQILSFQDSHSEVSMASLVSTLQQDSTELRQGQQKLASLPGLPNGLQSDAELQIRQKVRTTLLELRSSLEDWASKEHNVQYLTKQLLPWAKIDDEDPEPITNGIHHVSVTEVDHTAKAAANSVFVALQQLTNIKTQATSSIEESGWLVQNDRRFAESWAAIHASAVAEGLDILLRKIQHVPAQDLPLTIALLTVVAPVFEQFHAICEHMLTSQATVHLETCRLACYMAKTFSTLATEGYCSPTEKSDGQEQEGKMESGTGLGDGEGAEDISKDVGADEDLSEFAKDGQREDREGSIEDVEDAVDMGMDELEGETGEFEKKDGNEDDNSASGEEREEMEDETGNVDDLDPTAVDEKMWDEVKNEAEKEDDKELKGEKGKGEKTDDQTAAENGQKDGDDNTDTEHENGEPNEEEIDNDDDAGAGRVEAEHADPHLEEEKALELPEEMQLTGEEQGKEDDLSDDRTDQLSDVGQPEEVDQIGDADREESKSIDAEENTESGTEEAEHEGPAQEDEVREDQSSEDGEEKAHLEREGEMQYDEDGNAGGETGATNQLQDDIDHHQKAGGENEIETVDAERQQHGGQPTEDQENGKMGRGTLERGQGRETILERQQNEALKKLADVLDQWHQRREILNSSEDRQQGKLEEDADMAEADFEHVENEDEGDAQALGASGADQAQNLDQSRAFQDDNVPLNDDTTMPDPQEHIEEDNAVQRLNKLQAQAGLQRREDGSFVPDKDEMRAEQTDNDLGDTNSMIDDATSEIDHLELGQTEPPSPLTAAADATELWNYCSQATHQFSLILTEQLRLILSPTTATKLRGDYRTGKRLNLKRIIPYIASGYKRDKIWMRRSVPSKRNYQIMLAVDDSKSMAESGANVLALQSTAMLCKSLAMLEVGDVSLLSFGQAGQEGIKIAHSFGEVWKGEESGIEVFRNFSFSQKGTDVRALMETGLGVLRDGRLKVQRGREETWQLFLIISDGHCGEHERVRRLVREGKSERVLCVFIILDNLNTAPTDSGHEAKGESILDLKEAVFEPDPSKEGEMRVVTRRYLEKFPFEFYLVVRDVRELPGVLARCLKGWFGGVEGT